MTRVADLLGAHVSTAGGVHRAPARGRRIRANVIQVFTKTPNQWREPTITDEVVEAFRDEREAADLETVVAHDSYLINLASPDRTLRKRSLACFKGELTRCRTLGIPFIVSHPGNFVTDRQAGLRRVAKGYAECLDSVVGPAVLLETTAGVGTSIGSTFEELAEVRERIPVGLRGRVGFCADTCHLFAAGYDLVHDWPGVWRVWDHNLGLANLKCIHLNDSKTPFASRRDRHELIAEGSLGAEPFRRIMRDPRFASVVKIIETPKGDDAVKTDRRMLRRLRAYARQGVTATGHHH